VTLCGRTRHRQHPAALRTPLQCPAAVKTTTATALQCTLHPPAHPAAAHAIATAITALQHGTPACGITSMPRVQECKVPTFQELWEHTEVTESTVKKTYAQMYKEVVRPSPPLMRACCCRNVRSIGASPA
jgi:hypothetical protein